MIYVLHRACINQIMSERQTLDLDLQPLAFSSIFCVPVKVEYIEQNIDWHEEFSYRRALSRNERCQHVPQSGDTCRGNHYHKATYSKILLQHRHWHFAQLRSHRYLVLLGFHSCSLTLDIAVTLMDPTEHRLSRTSTSSMELYTIGSFPCIQLCQALGNNTAIPDPDERLSAYSETRHQSIGPSDLPLLAISAIVRPMERCDAAAWRSTGQPYFFSHIVEPPIILFPP